MREALALIQSLLELQGLWARNAITINQLRTILPELKTALGTHYADVLEKLYEQHGVRHASLSKQDETVRETGTAGSVFLLPHPKRIRDASHLQFVASLPCLVCGRLPSQAHHLKFAQPRALASKSSDEWTVPLCLLHHRALHDVGSEETWWEEQGVDAKGEAQRLWHRTQGGGAREPEVAQSAE